MENEAITVEAQAAPTQALTLRPETGQVPMEPEAKAPITSAQARVVEVTEALAPAYQKASTLELSDEEVEKLMAPFPDDVVEVRPHDGLIYIPHIFISDRLNRIFKPGKWSLVCRRHWMENNTMYGEYVLLIRGCYVGESVGGHPYVPSNPKTNYSDSLESTAAEALRRIAGKRLSCGSQVWNPEYARQWCAKYSQQRGGKYYKVTAPQTVLSPTPPSTPAPAPKPAPAPSQGPKQATPATREWMIQAIGEERMPQALAYFLYLGWIYEGETAFALELDKVPTSKESLNRLIEAIDAFKDGTVVDYREMKPVAAPRPAPVQVPRDPNCDPNSPDAPWRSFPMPFGKHAGVKLADLEKSYLYGLWANFTVETTYNGKAKNPETIAKDTKFREMLDAAGLHYEFTKKD